MPIEELHTTHANEDPAPDEGTVTFARLPGGDDSCVLEIRGDLDIAVSGLLGHELDDLIDAGTGKVAVDLSGVQFMDSSALSALVQAHERARERKQQFVLLRPSPACAKVLNITGLDRVFGVS